MLLQALAWLHDQDCENKMKKFARILLLSSIIFSTACAGTATQPEDQFAMGPGAWIDAPLDGSTIPMAEYEVISHANDASGISAFELSVNGEVISIDAVEANQQGLAIAHIGQAWLPTVPGSYLLKVRAANTNGDYGPPAFAKVIVGEESEEVEPTPTASATPAKLVLIAIPTQNVNCRLGNGSLFDIADTLFMGVEYSPIARGPDDMWLLFSGPANGERCWVFINNLELTLNGDAVEIGEVPVSVLPVAPYPPMPTLTSTPEGPAPTHTPTPCGHC